MAVEVLMPKLGLTMTTGAVVKWLKSEGDYVAKGEDLLEISTEKIVNTVESPAAGFLLKIIAVEGTELPVGALLGFIGAQNEQADAAVPGEGPAPAADSAARSRWPEEDQPGAGHPDRERFRISPLAAKRAKELNVNYTVIAGTGPGGRITRADVERFAAGDRSTGETAISPSRRAEGAASSSFNVIPYAGLRKVIGENMSRSRTVAAKVTEHVSVDVSGLTAFRKLINKGLQEGEVNITLTDLLVKIVAAALALKPNVNVSLDGGNIKVLKEINIGVAVALESGLVVPVVRNAAKKDILRISTEIRELADKARAGKLDMDDMSMGTFTISNLGSYGSVDYFTPIINQPESAILGIGRIVETPVAVDGRIVIRPMMGLSLSFDHRIIDGAPAAEFLAAVIRLIANPVRTVLATG